MKYSVNIMAPHDLKQPSHVRHISPNKIHLIQEIVYPSRVRGNIKSNNIFFLCQQGSNKTGADETAASCDESAQLWSHLQ
jgi:hypothetical protein